MNRLTPLIHRRSRSAFTTLPLPAVRVPQAAAEEPGWLRDAKLFGLSYIAGIVVFSTFLA